MKLTTTVMNKTMNVELLKRSFNRTKRNFANVFMVLNVRDVNCEYFEHCSKDKVDTIYRRCKHILNNDYQYDQKNLQNVKVKCMPIRFHVRAMADPEQPLLGILSGLATLALPMMKTFFRMMRDHD